MPSLEDEQAIKDKRPPMVGSYLGVYIFALAMIFLTFAASIATQSKVLLGPVIWGYVVYLMHKRKNASLVTFFKTLLFIAGIGGTAIVLVYFNKYGFNENSAGELPTFEYILMTIFGLIVFYSFMKYFQRQIKAAEDGRIAIDMPMPAMQEKIQATESSSVPVGLIRSDSEISAKQEKLNQTQLNEMRAMISPVNLTVTKLRNSIGLLIRAALARPIALSVMLVCITALLITWLVIYTSPFQTCMRMQEEQMQNGYTAGAGQVAECMYWGAPRAPSQ